MIVLVIDAAIFIALAVVRVRSIDSFSTLSPIANKTPRCLESRKSAIVELQNSQWTFR